MSRAGLWPALALPAFLPMVLPMLLAACAGPPVETASVPPVVAPEAWRGAAGNAGSIPLAAAWWTAFGDPRLDALVATALADNPDIAIAGARLREARAQIDLARAALLPTLDASLAGSRSRSVNAFGQPSEGTAAQPQLQAAWEVDVFGRLSDQAAAARASWQASGAARDAVRLSIASATASTWIGLLALDERLAVARRTVAIRQGSRDLIARRVNAGYSPRLELEQAEVDLQAAALLVPALEQARTRQENALSLLAGRLPGAIDRPDTGLEALRRPALPASLPSELLRRRPDVAQAEYQLAASDANLAAARKRFLPQLRLSASAGAAISSLLADPVGLWSVGGSILAPLFQGGRLRAGAQTAGAQRDAAAFAYRKAALTAFRDVEDALAAVDGLDRQVAIQTTQRAALAEAYRLASNRYREGYSPLLEQLDSQRGLLSAELALVQARADALNARVALFQALGGGWSSP